MSFLWLQVRHFGYYFVCNPSRKMRLTFHFFPTIVLIVATAWVVPSAARSKSTAKVFWYHHARHASLSIYHFVVLTCHHYLVVCHTTNPEHDATTAFTQLEAFCATNNCCTDNNGQVNTAACGIDYWDLTSEHTVCPNQCNGDNACQNHFGNGQGKSLVTSTK